MSMERFNILLEKRKNLTATIFEEQELIMLSKTLPAEQLKGVDRSLFTYTNSDRLQSLNDKLDELIAKL